jgi:NAD(P)-dependent dehydrogenase (short-subunit alcohol dehydrogenase family)
MTGIGLETARMLAKMGADVTIACRNAKKAQDAVNDIESTTGNKPAVATLDLSQLSSVAAFTDDFIKSHDRLDILVNNAGISSTSSREEGLTGDGFEIE